MWYGCAIPKATGSRNVPLSEEAVAILEIYDYEKRSASKRADYDEDVEALIELNLAALTKCLEQLS